MAALWRTKPSPSPHKNVTKRQLVRGRSNYAIFPAKGNEVGRNHKVEHQTKGKHASAFLPMPFTLHPNLHLTAGDFNPAVFQCRRQMIIGHRTLKSR